MNIALISIDNFRSISHLDLALGKKLTLLIGENGSGKTSILDAIAVGLGAVVTLLPKVSGARMKRADIRQYNNQQLPYTRIKIHTNEDLVWDRTGKRDLSRKTAAQIPPAVGLVNLKRFIDKEIINPFNEGVTFPIPVFSYYGVNRALLDVPLRRRGFPKSHLRFESFENAMNAVSRFKAAFVWFYNKEFEEQKKQKELRSFDYRLPELEVVRSAVGQLFPDISEPHIMLNPLRFALKFGNEILDITQLSDGYKTLLSLIIDLSSRMALANPQLENPLKSAAIVLIDEIDLHLHPEWQRRILGDLMNVFPNTQFVITTHSPYIIEAVNNHLMRYRIKEFKITESDIQTIVPLSPNDLQAYYLKEGDAIKVIDEELNLIDDQLIHPFNSITKLYEKMRDIQWENEAND